MPTIPVGDTQLYYERYGAGPAVLFVSGLRGVASHWRNQVPVFSQSFTVVAHDQRGTGNSEHSVIHYSVEQMAEDVIGLMDALEIASAHFIGHSTGAAIGQVLAIEQPSRLNSLTLISGWTAADKYFRLNFELRAELLKTLGPDAFDRYSTLFVNPPWYINSSEAGAHAQTKTPPVEVTLSRIEAILKFDRSKQLSEIKLPTLVACSGDDRLTPQYFSEELARSIPGAKLRLLENGGHSCHQTQPGAFNDIVLEFVRAVEKKRGQTVHA